LIKVEYGVEAGPVSIKNVLVPQRVVESIPLGRVSEQGVRKQTERLEPGLEAHSAHVYNNLLPRNCVRRGRTVGAVVVVLVRPIVQGGVTGRTITNIE